MTKNDDNNVYLWKIVIFELELLDERITFHKLLKKFSGI